MTVQVLHQRLKTVCFAAGVTLLLFGVCACSASSRYEAGPEEENAKSRMDGEAETSEVLEESEISKESEASKESEISKESEASRGSEDSAGGEAKAPEDTASENQTVPEPDTPSYLYVYVCGEVKFSGVYRLENGARLYEAVDAAGGFLPDADESSLNLAMPLEDGMQVTVPREGEDITVPVIQTSGQTLAPSGSTGASLFAGETTSGGDVQTVYDGKINLNTASAQVLETLPGIGEVKAGNIISYRESHGGFTDISQLREVDGIGDKLYEKIREQVTVLNE